MEERKYIEEDEINLRELSQTIGRYKKFIIFFSLIVTSLSVVFVIFQPNIYKSELMLSSQDDSQSGNGGLNALAGLAGIDVGKEEEIFLLLLISKHYYKIDLFITELLQNI